MIHCEVGVFAGQRKAARGKAGRWLFVFGSRSAALSRVNAEAVEVFCFLRVLWGVDVGAIDLRLRYESGAAA